MKLVETCWKLNMRDRYGGDWDLITLVWWYLQVQRLEKIVRESESGLGTASSQINSLRDASHRLQSELEKTREELRSSKTTAASLKVDNS